IAPILSERTEVKLDAERAEKRLAHWRGVLVAACEQCGRARLPELAAPMPLAHWAAAAPEGLKLALDPEGELRLEALTPRTQGLGVVGGPEGAPAKRELETLRAAGFRGLRLGPRILRTETAGLAAIAALPSRLGDLGHHGDH